MFGLFPVGYMVSSVPYGHVERVGCGTVINVKHLVAGACLALMTLFVLTTPGRMLFGGNLYDASWSLTATVVFLFCSTGSVMSFVTARVVGMFFSAGDGRMAIRTRGHELSQVRETARRVNSLIIWGEPGRSL